MDILEAMALAMCNAYRIDPEAPSLGRDNVTRTALDSRIKELKAAFEFAGKQGYVMRQSVA